MSIYDEYSKQIPEYYPTMHLDGFNPEEIMFAFKRDVVSKLLDRDPQQSKEIHFSTTIEVKK